jgi:murein DD-endopeptidase MepM/ murein hydrolase activator NlpD
MMSRETKELLAVGAGALALLALSIRRPVISGARAMGFDYSGGKGLLPHGHVSSGFGMRQLPGEEEKMHMGIDIISDKGTPVRAALAGTVVDMSTDGQRTGYGNVVILQHTEGALTMYAHLDRFAPAIHIGAVVPQGAVIGYVGQTHLPQTGDMPAHLHFEVHENAVWSPTGRLTVNPEVPARFEPIAWLAQHGRAPTDAG